MLVVATCSKHKQEVVEILITIQKKREKDGNSEDREMVTLE